jgi:hypothetical protein
MTMFHADETARNVQSPLGLRSTTDSCGTDRLFA